MGFDTGPGNVFLDLAISDMTEGKILFDEDGDFLNILKFFKKIPGKFASQGEVISPLLEYCLSHPYYSYPPPKVRFLFRRKIPEKFPNRQQEENYFLGLCI